MDSTVNIGIEHDLDSVLQPDILISNNNKIVYVSEFYKNRLDKDENGEYQLPYIEKMEWNHFFTEIRQQYYAVHEKVFFVNHQAYQRIEGFFNIVDDTITLSFSKRGFRPGIDYKNPSLQLMDFLGIGVMLFTREGIVLDINAHVSHMTGYTRNQLIALNPSTIKNYFSYSDTEFTQLLTQLKAEDEGTIIIQKASAENTFYKVKIKYNRVQGIYYGCVFEHTEYMHMQTELKEQQFLKEMGQVTAAIVHEIRNPLATLKGFTDLMKREATTEQLSYFNIMEQEFNRLDTLLNELLYLARPEDSIHQQVDLKAVVKEVAQFMYYEAIQKKIFIQLKYEQNRSFLILGNTDRLKQVVINLIKNSIQAMEQGDIFIHLTETENAVQLIIRDEGKGMDEEVCKKIFTPFYTTKEEGTGLGLSIVRKIVEDSNGFIEVKSVPNGGTSFYLSFPKIVGQIYYKNFDKTFSL